MNLVDSSAWLAYFAGEKNADFFAGAIEDSELLLVPTICLYEVFKVILRERGEDEAFQAVAAMQQGSVVDLTAELALESAAVGHDEKLALADSIIYAVARVHDATIWTQDEHFAGKPNVEFRSKTRRPRGSDCDWRPRIHPFLAVFVSPVSEARIFFELHKKRSYSFF